MRAKWMAVLVVLAITGLSASNAFAATEFGNHCTGNRSSNKFSVIGTANGPGNSLPATAPTSGVITSWTFNIVPIPSGVLSQTLKVFRPTGGNQYQVVAESSPALLSSGSNTFSTRLPVNAGDHIGTSGTASGEAITVYCESGNPGDRLGAISGNPTVGASASVLEEGAGFQVPITAVIEPDADHDGYGDETQDKCPQSAATQAPCPVAALTTSSSVQKGLVKVIVTSSVQATVTVGGTVKLGKGKTATLSGGTQVVAPGTLAQFTVLFPPKLKAKLKSLSRKQSLKLSLTASAPNVAGPPTVSALSIKVKGQKKAKRKQAQRSGRAAD